MSLKQSRVSNQKDVKKYSLKSNFMWVLIGNVIFGLSQWLIIAVMSKIGNINMVGEYTLALGITAPLFLFFNMNLRYVQATDQQNEYNFVDYFSLRSLTSLVSLILIILSTYIFKYSLSTSLIIIMVGLIKYIESQSDVIYGFFQKKENMKLISQSYILKGFLNVITFILILETTNNLLVCLIIMAVLNMFVFLFFDMKNFYELGEKKLKLIDYLGVLKNKKKFILIVATVIPLGIASSLDSLTINSQRYIIESTISITEVGYFSSITYLMISGQTIVGALSQASLPRLSRYFVEDFKKYLKFTFSLLAVGILLGLFLILSSYFIGDVILSILYTKDFAKYSNVFLIVMVAASVWYITGFLNSALVATRQFNSQLIVYSLSFIVTLILSLILIKEYGLVGAAYSLLAGMITRLLVITLVLIKILTRRKCINSIYPRI